jgi:hypothetical protein
MTSMSLFQQSWNNAKVYLPLFEVLMAHSDLTFVESLPVTTTNFEQGKGKSNIAPYQCGTFKTDLHRSSSPFPSPPPIRKVKQRPKLRFRSFRLSFISRYSNVWIEPRQSVLVWRPRSSIQSTRSFVVSSLSRHVAPKSYPARVDASYSVFWRSGSEKQVWWLVVRSWSSSHGGRNQRWRKMTLFGESITGGRLTRVHWLRNW